MPCSNLPNMADPDSAPDRAPMHDGQLLVTAATVRGLVADQFPEWADLPVTEVTTEGTVNAIFRIGDHLTARFPLEAGDVATVRRWLQTEAHASWELVGRTRFPVPEPVGLGDPGPGYGLPWSIQTWLPGATATAADPSRSEGFAEDLAEFITGVRGIDTRGRTFARTGRGGDLHAHDAWVETCLAKSTGLLDVPRLRAFWLERRDLLRVAPDAMTHGDLVPGNVLVADGRLAGVLDCGGLGPADPALDLVGAWHLLEDGPRHRFRTELGVDDLDWERGRAWAFEQALGLVWYYAASNPAMSAMGRRTLERLVTGGVSLP